MRRQGSEHSSEELQELIAEGDRVVVHSAISGTQNGQGAPLPPTGKRVQFEEIVMFQIRDGKVRRQRGFADNLRPSGKSA